MAAQLIEATDVIDVSAPPVLLYGEPGAGKTSLANTADNPLTLDFDGGAHRSMFRKRVLRFTAWEDCIDVWNNGMKRDGVEIFAPRFADHQTVILDTVGTMLDLTKPAVLAANTRNGTKAGGLSQTGWGALKDSFDTFRAQLKAAAKQLIMIAHEKNEKEGDEIKKRPAIVGGSYDIVMQAADIVGYLSSRNNRRFLSFDPTDRYFAKNGGRLDAHEVPDFGTVPDHFARLLAQAKANLGKTAAASAEAARVLGDYQAFLDGDPSLDAVHAKLDEARKLHGGVRAQVWKLILDRMTKAGYDYDQKAKRFAAKQEAA